MRLRIWQLCWGSELSHFFANFPPLFPPSQLKKFLCWATELTGVFFLLEKQIITFFWKGGIYHTELRYWARGTKYNSWLIKIFLLCWAAELTHFFSRGGIVCFLNKLNLIFTTVLSYWASFSFFLFFLFFIFKMKTKRKKKNLKIIHCSAQCTYLANFR